MSLKIIKAGICDSVQDLGRKGYQHLGINTGGVMDPYAAGLANALLGKNIASPVLEVHFPAAHFLFEEATIFCITGALFSPQVNGVAIPMNHPIVVNKNVVLQFTQWQWGAWAYLSFLPMLEIEPWLNSYSTNTKAAAGGYHGRILKSDDRLFFKEKIAVASLINNNDFLVLPWQAPYLEKTNMIGFIRGNEWGWFAGDVLHFLEKNVFHVSEEADRMGYRLMGKNLYQKEVSELVSAPVNFGTIQALPGGQLIVLMADHQTTGGYPRVAHVIAADLPLLAQLSVKEALYFHCVGLEVAEKKYVDQQHKLLQLQEICYYKMKEIL